MTSHTLTAAELSDESLLARIWQLDPSAEQVQQIDQLIATDAIVGERFQRMLSDLQALMPQPVALAPPDLLARLQRRLRLHAQPSQAKPHWTKLAVAFSAGALATMILVNVQPPVAPVPVPAVRPEPHADRESRESGTEDKSRESVTAHAANPGLRSVALHLNDAQKLLRGFALKRSDQKEQRELLEDAIAQNYGLQLRAKQHGRSDLARLLAALQPCVLSD